MMKFKKLQLEESLFDTPLFVSDGESYHWSPAEDIFGKGTDNCIPTFGDIDDDFSELDGVPSDESMMAAPETKEDLGVSGTIIDAINDEWSTINKYNGIIAVLRDLGSDYDSMIKVVEDIVAEENKHVGQLQAMLKQISPNASLIDKGEQEGNSQLEFRDGKLQVQSWDNMKSNSGSVVSDPNCPTGDDLCFVSDVDDEM